MSDLRVISESQAKEVIFQKRKIYLLSSFISYFLKVAKNHNVEYIETSAKNNVNIDQAFRDLATKIVEKVISNFPLLNFNSKCYYNL